MKKFIFALLLMLSPFAAHGNYDVFSSVGLNLGDNTPEHYVIFDLPQFYMKGETSDHWYVECYVLFQGGATREQKVATVGKFLLTVKTWKYCPAPGAMTDSTSTINLNNKGENHYRMKFYMGSVARKNKVSRVSFNIKKLDSNLWDSIRISCWPFE